MIKEVFKFTRVVYSTGPMSHPLARNVKSNLIAESCTPYNLETL